MKPFNSRSRARFSLLAAHLAVLLSAITGVVALTGSPASATCSHVWRNIDPGSDQVSGASGGLALRTGPHTSCPLVKRIPNGHWVTLECYTEGDSVNGYPYWSRVNYGNGSGSWSGWVSDYYLADNGSPFNCRY